MRLHSVKHLIQTPPFHRSVYIPPCRPFYLPSSFIHVLTHLRPSNRFFLISFPWQVLSSLAHDLIARVRIPGAYGEPAAEKGECHFGKKKEQIGSLWLMGRNVICIIAWSLFRYMGPLVYCRV